MITIQISSDPYKRKITYDRVEDEQLIAIDSSNPDISEKLRLLSVDYSSCFFPFKAYEIVNQIQETYLTPSTPVCIRFRGTAEEYEELRAVCDIINKENEKENEKRTAEEQLPPLTYEQASDYLANARDILSEVTKYFKSIKNIIANNIKASESKRLIDLQQERFDDVSKTEIPVCVIGNYSSGKSTFINALLGCEVLPSSDKSLTAKIYEIRDSDNSEKADVQFIMNHLEITITFNRGCYTICPESYSDELSAKIRECLEREKESSLAKRVQSLLQIINNKEIDDRVKMHIPFNSDSPLRSSEHPYVLFDTPGDGAVTEENHIQVLQEALHGMSNGLMLFITESKRLQSETNQHLCEKVKAIQEIDTRFTMVIVNQADDADFSDHNRKDVIESVIPQALQPEGIYYVSSIIALGAKTDGVFIKEKNERIYRNNKGDFILRDGEKYARLLFQYNIAPKQIEAASKEGALRYGEYGDKERILANSGLWAIEQEIQRFADNYAPYNKCYQSLLFLLKVREIAETAIAKAVKMHDESRSKYQSQLDAGTQKLLLKLTMCRDEFIEKAKDGYPTEMDTSKREAYTPISKAELIKLEDELTASIETAYGYSERVAIADKAREKTFKIQNVFDADVRADMAISYKYWREKSAERDNTREKIDTTAADQLLTQVKEKFNFAINHAQTLLFQFSISYWKERAENLRKELLVIVLASQDISKEKREELQELIEGFERITFTGEVEKIFEKEIFERRAFFGFFEDHHLNKQKLSSRFNRSLKDGINDIYLQMKSSHARIFTEWQMRLFSVIEDNITDLNPSLRDDKEKVAYYKDLIESYRTAQEELNKNIDKINQLMDWKPFFDESSTEE